MRALLVALALSFAAAPALAQDRPADWIKRPTAEWLIELWPSAAIAKEIGGKALIQCIVSIHGALHNCTVVSEEPVGLGFGKAAVTSTVQLVMRPALQGGRPVESVVQIPIEFEKPKPVQGAMQRLPFRYLGPMPNFVIDVPWEKAATFADVQDAYPTRAAAKGLVGHATAFCFFNPRFKPTACGWSSEEPEGQGFGPAAERLMSQFQGPADWLDERTRNLTYVLVPFTFAPEQFGQPAPPLTKPQWRGTPSGAEFGASVPKEAARRAVAAGVSAVTVTLACVAAPDGTLVDCAVESESPAGYDFGPAALSLAPKFRMQVWSGEGLPIAGRPVKIPLRYGLSAARPR